MIAGFPRVSCVGDPRCRSPLAIAERPNTAKTTTRGGIQIKSRYVFRQDLIAVRKHLPCKDSEVEGLGTLPSTPSYRHEKNEINGGKP